MKNIAVCLAIIGLVVAVGMLYHDIQQTKKDIEVVKSIESALDEIDRSLPDINIDDPSVVEVPDIELMSLGIKKGGFPEGSIPETALDVGGAVCYGAMVFIVAGDWDPRTFTLEAELVLNEMILRAGLELFDIFGENLSDDQISKLRIMVRDPSRIYI